ncbi:MAG: hypothetical protein JRM91_03310 [Nitrososphaerota archaeon]|nr:hypothetical protein [Nitrososphaerota archaeon]
MTEKKEENPFLTLIDDYKRGKLPESRGAGETERRPSQHRKRTRTRSGGTVITIIPHFQRVTSAYSDSKDPKLRWYVRSAFEAISQLQKVENGAKIVDLKRYKRTIESNPDIRITKSLVLAEPDQMPREMFIRKVVGWDALQAKELGI